MEYIGEINFEGGSDLFYISALNDIELTDVGNAGQGTYDLYLIENRILLLSRYWHGDVGDMDDNNEWITDGAAPHIEYPNDFILPFKEYLFDEKDEFLYLNVVDKISMEEYDIKAKSGTYKVHYAYDDSDLSIISIDLNQRYKISEQTCGINCGYNLKIEKL